jgi:uncharacterized membrane protein
MLARFANVVCWVALLASGLLLFFAALGFVFGNGLSEPASEIVAIVLALLIWAAGRAVLYVLAAR